VYVNKRNAIAIYFDITTINSLLLCQQHVITTILCLVINHPLGAVVRASAQRSDDPCIAGSNLTVANEGAGLSDETV
jgi:hypothetical protein